MFAEFRMSTDMIEAMQDVRDKIAQVRPGFPRDVKEPLVIRADHENHAAGGVARRAVADDGPARAHVADRPDDRQGAGERAGRGAHRRQRPLTRQILVQIKPNALTALGIGVDQVTNAIRAANQDVPAGRITRGQSDSIVRVEGKIKDPAQFGRIIVAQQGGGPVYLSQVADVIDGEKEPDSISRASTAARRSRSTCRRRRTPTSSRPAAA